MASTWSALKIELLETGQNSGTWGTATNVNLGDAILGEAITGQATVDFATDADVTITLTDSATSQSARNLRLNITESSTGIGSVRNLILGSGCQIEKFYLINNTGTGAKTVKNTSGTGISVPAGKATLVYNNGTNVVDAASYFTSLTLGSALPIASGGTGSTSTTFVNLASNVTGTLPANNGGTGVANTGKTITLGGNLTTSGAFATTLTTTGTTSLTLPTTGTVTALGNATIGSGSIVLNTSTTLVTPNLGTPTSVTLTNATGLPISTGVSGLGTGVATFLATPSYSNLSTAVTGDTVVGAAATQTLTNKRVTPRVSTSTANSATPTLNTDNFDMMVITAQTVAITSFTTNLTGTPTNGQKLWISITGTAAVALTFGASFEASTVSLPTTTVTTNRLDIGFVWNVATSKWRCVATA